MKYSRIILFVACAFTLQCLTVSSVNAQKKMDKEDFRKSAPEAGPAPRISLGEFSQFTLDNGLKVIVVENHKLPRISFRILVDRQPMLEGDRAGYVDIAGQLLSRGTENRSREEIDESVDFIGASFSTSSSGMFGSSLTKHTEELLDIMTDVLYNPTFPEDEFENIKTQVISGLQTQKTDPSAISSTVTSVANFGSDHPFGEVTTEETVNNVTVEQAREFYNTYWKPNISYLAIVGDIDVDDAREMAEEYFGKWERGEVPVRDVPVAEKPEATKVVFVDNPGAVQSVIKLSYPIQLHPADPDAVTAELMNNILGGGVFSGYLMQNLREDKGYTYGAGSSISPSRYVGTFTAGASVRNEVTDSAVTQFLHEMERIRTEEVDPDHLQLVKNSMSGQFARSLENPNSLASKVLDIARFGLPEDYYDTYLEKINAVSEEEITRVAQKYIRPERANIVVVGNRDEVAEKLEGFSAGGEIDYRDYYGRPVEEAGAIPEGLSAEDVIEDYYSALGGKEKLESVTDAKFIYKSNIGGQEMVMEMYQKEPSMMLFQVSFGGIVQQRQLLNGDKAYQTAQGQTMEIQGEQLEEMKREAKIFKETDYMAEGYTLELKGIEELDQGKAYRLVVESPNGDKTTEYYDVESGLKVKEINTQEGQGQTVTINTVYEDYQDYDGIKIPSKVTVTGVAPFPIVQEVDTVELNSGLSDDIFKIEQ